MVAEIDPHEQLMSVDLRRELEIFISRRAARRAGADDGTSEGGELSR